MTAKIVDREQRREEIAKAAMGLFSVKGFETTSISQVARAAGIGKGTVYEYFSSKDELIATSILLWCESIIEGAMSIIREIKDPEQKLRTFVLLSVEPLIANEHSIKTSVFIFQLILSKLDNQVFFNTLQQAFSNMGDIIVDIIMEGRQQGVFHITDEKEAEMLAINLMAFLDGILLHHMIIGEKFNLLSQVEHYMKYLLDVNLRVRMQEEKQ
ncbi:MAG: TetR/AcrR family transcriptional regulator [bacterium]